MRRYILWTLVSLCLAASALAQNPDPAARERERYAAESRAKNKAMEQAQRERDAKWRAEREREEKAAFERDRERERDSADRERAAKERTANAERERTANTAANTTSYSTIESYDEAIRLNPSASALLVGRGNIYFAQRDYVSAGNDFSRATAMDATSSYAFLRSGEAAFERGLRYCSMAISGFSQAIKLQPLQKPAVRPFVDRYSLARAYWKRALCYHDSGQHELAIADYSTSITLYPDNVSLYLFRGRDYLSVRRYDNAIQDMDELIKRNPGNNGAEPQLIRGQAFHGKGHYKRAIQEFDEILRISPGHAEALYWRGRAKQKLGNAAGGADDIQHARKIYPDVGKAN